MDPIEEKRDAETTARRVLFDPLADGVVRLASDHDEMRRLVAVISSVRIKVVQILLKLTDSPVVRLTNLELNPH